MIDFWTLCTGFITSWLHIRGVMMSFLCQWLQVKKLPLFLDLTHVNPYSVKSNFRVDNLRCFSKVIESNFCLRGFEYWLSSRKHKGISHRISWFFLVVPSLISCLIVMFCLLVSVRHVLAVLISLNVHRKTELF